MNRTLTVDELLEAVKKPVPACVSRSGYPNEYAYRWIAEHQDHFSHYVVVLDDGQGDKISFKNAIRGWCKETGEDYDEVLKKLADAYLTEHNYSLL